MSPAYLALLILAAATLALVASGSVRVNEPEPAAFLTSPPTEGMAV